MPKKKYLDVTDQVCPMAFVNTKLFVDSLPSDIEKIILVKGDDNSKSIVNSLQGLNYDVKVTAKDRDIFQLTVLKVL